MAAAFTSVWRGRQLKKEDTIVLGYIGPLTGESALWGEVESNTLKMLVEETNANGGIIGKQIDLKIYDNRGDAVETTNAARKAIQNDGVVAFIGPDLLQELSLWMKFVMSMGFSYHHHWYKL